MPAKVRGLKQTQDNMKLLPGRIQKGALSSGLRAGGEVYRKAVVVNAKDIDDRKTPLQQIWKKIRNRAGKKRSRSLGGEPVQSVQVERSKSSALQREIASHRFKHYPGDVFYWRFLEFGTRHAPPKKFMRPAFESSSQAATSAVAQGAAKALGKSIPKFKQTGR